jgi:hypothetical protein
MTRIPIKKPEHKRKHVALKDLMTRWELSVSDIYTYAQRGDLDIVIPWRRLREEQCNTLCVHSEEWMRLPFTFFDLSPHYISPCMACPRKKDEAACIFDYSDGSRCRASNTVPSEEKFRYQIHVESAYFFVHSEEVKRFEDKFKETDPIPPYLQPDHKFYSQDMAILAETWHVIFEKREGLDKRSCKQTASAFIEAKFGLKGTKRDTLASIIHACFKGTWSDFVREAGKDAPSGS